MFAKSTFVAFLALASSVSAGGLSLNLRTSYNFGCSSSIKAKATTPQRDSCSSSGSFFTEYQGNPLCVSSSTRTPPPSDLTCPFNWGSHKTAKCCVPETEVSPCDCGEGYTFNSNEKKCVANHGGGCGQDQWYHDRSSSCCDNSWHWSPPTGPCPKGITCPTDWFWHKDHQKCKPHHPRSPEPDCDDWDQKNQCCGGGGSGPSQGVSGGSWKRNFKAREQIALFPQSNLDKMYCPSPLHACTVPTTTGGEWSYECIDFETELESCGGCASTGEGVDCTKIPNVLGVGCESGVCAVYTCEAGFAANGTECVAI
ncbi:hypothetical protein CI109_105088 [Kwoniella shandongensis]|uniref:Protein CPL1-like domain-containing protein n=1 Tax=Kwoniella shandongensis TaxID=1734106 RepID=A0A5M6BZK1_9TREE|nr:uncharacterized protein CI109_004312 [Kwoniella shandongensis]KAA5527252.1 hypothetical protein CI109_004312 [Kwoniella shandongensis]